MNIDYNKLNLQVNNNRIINLEEVLAYLNEIEINETINQYLETLLNKIKYNEFENKDELINAITSKLLQYKSIIEEEQMNNAATLRALQEKNEDFKKINIIETKKESNDSNKNIDYLTFTNDDGTIEVLVCEGNNTLNDFIKEHSDNIGNMSAKDIFNHFQKYIHRELDFYSNEELNKRELNNQAIVREEETKQAEREILEEYRKKYGLLSDIEISIDPNGERLYRIGDGLFKFRTTNGKRELETLVQPSVKKDNTIDLLTELDETPQIEANRTEVMNTNEKVETYDSLEVIDYSVFNKDDFYDLTRKRDIYEIELSASEYHRLNVYIKFLISTMIDRTRSQESNNEYGEMLKGYLESGSPSTGKESIVETYKSIQDGIINANTLSELDKEFARKYLDNLQHIQSLGLEKKNERILELKPNNSSGVATLVILLEIGALALFILMFLSLDI